MTSDGAATTSDYSTSASSTWASHARGDSKSSLFTDLSSSSNSRQNSAVYKPDSAAALHMRARSGQPSARAPDVGHHVRRQRPVPKSVTSPRHAQDAKHGKFFVVSTMPSPVDRRRVTQRAQTTDRAPAAFDVRKVAQKSTLQRRERVDRGGEGRGLSRCGGSLDSLIDASRLDASYDSDPVEPPPEREPQQVLATNDASRQRSHTMGVPRAKRPNSVVLTIGGDRHLVPREVIDRFRDPTLQRVTAPRGADPQIGVACRFERSDVSDARTPLKASDDLSPITRRRYDSEEMRRKRDHRRHTVAGAGDSVEALIAALTAVTPTRAHESPSHCSPPSGSASAWERLRPAMERRAPRTMQSWLKEERLRQARSASDLLDLDDEPMPEVAHLRVRSSEQTPTHHPAPAPSRTLLRRQIYSPAEQRAARRRLRRESAESPVTSPTAASPTFTSTRGAIVASVDRRASRNDNFTFESSL